MCIVVDMNTLPAVFDSSNARHTQYRGVLNWIIVGDGKLVQGGTKYKKELGKLGRIRRLFIELAKVGKVISIPTSQVDEYEVYIQQKHNLAQKEDAHIVAIIAQSNCRLVCSYDKRAYPLFKTKNLYPKGTKVPSIYKGPKNNNLLSPKYIAKCCAGRCRLPRSTQNIFKEKCKNAFKRK